MITYTWNGQNGTIGLNGYNPYKLLDKNAFGLYYMKVRETMPETKILKNLLSSGVIEVPDEKHESGFLSRGNL